MKPTIIVGCDSGVHNKDLEATRERLKNAQQYRDCSTAILTPTRGMIPAMAVQSWLYLMGPANARIGRLFCQGMEVGSAYESGFTTILQDPNMGDAKFILTLEDDNIPPPDGLLKLYENICHCDVPCKEHFVIVSGLYFMKGEMGQPMLFGDPNDIDPISFQPQVPEKDTIQECNGSGMGFALFHSGLFRDKDLPRPWFKTDQKYTSKQGDMDLGGARFEIYTQDLYFMERLRKLGYRIAVDTRVKVGHYDAETEMVW